MSGESTVSTVSIWDEVWVLVDGIENRLNSVDTAQEPDQSTEPWRCSWVAA